jgi:hypothetical protein
MSCYILDSTVTLYATVTPIDDAREWLMADKSERSSNARLQDRILLYLGGHEDVDTVAGLALALGTPQRSSVRPTDIAKERAWKDSNLRHTAPETDSGLPGFRGWLNFPLENTIFIELAPAAPGGLNCCEPVLNLYPNFSSPLPPTL